MARSAVHVIRHVEDEPFFIACGGNLRNALGQQVATITAVQCALEKENRSTGLYEEVLDEDGFASVQIIDDPDSGLTDDMVAGLISINVAETQPTAGEGYKLVAHCTITFLPAYGGGQAKRDFVRPVRIAASFETAPAS